MLMVLVVVLFSGLSFFRKKAASGGSRATE
jgi:hypothetical protein